MIRVPSNFVLFAMTDCKEAVQKAKEYVMKYDLSKKTKILRQEGKIIVVVKEPLTLGEP